MINPNVKDNSNILDNPNKVKKRVTDPANEDYVPYTASERLNQFVLGVSGVAKSDSIFADYLQRSYEERQKKDSFVAKPDSVAQDTSTTAPPAMLSDNESDKSGTKSPLAEMDPKAVIEDPNVKAFLGQTDEQGVSIFDSAMEKLNNAKSEFGKKALPSVSSPSAINGERVAEINGEDRYNKNSYLGLKSPEDGNFEIKSSLPDIETEAKAEKKTIGEFLSSGKGNLMLAEIALALSQPGSPNAQVASMLVEQAKAKKFDEGDLSGLSVSERLAFNKSKTDEQLLSLEGENLKLRNKELETGRIYDETKSQNASDRAFKNAQKLEKERRISDAEHLNNTTKIKDYFNEQSDLKGRQLLLSKYQYEDAIKKGATETEAKAKRVENNDKAVRSFSNDIWNKLTNGERVGLATGAYNLKNPKKTGRDYAEAVKGFLKTQVSNGIMTKGEASNYMKSSTFLGLSYLSSDAEVTQAVDKEGNTLDGYVVTYTDADYNKHYALYDFEMRSQYDTIINQK